MNNLTLGNDDFTYYETLGGGQGACADADGPSAVHVAMSNTLNTPIEALELEFPLRAVEYALRRGSGGAGRHRGGDGVVRELEALAEMRYSLITERRRHAPPGADGGEPGARGRNLINGEELPAKASGTLQRRRPAANRDTWRWRTWQGLRRSASSAWASWAPRWRATCARRATTLSVYTRTREKAERFAAEHGARAAATPAEAAEGADAFITMVPDAPAGRGGAARRPAPRTPARVRARDRHVHDPAAAPRARSASWSPRARSSKRRCPAPSRRPRTARWRSSSAATAPPTSARCRCSR